VDKLYVLARQVLLDVLEALGEHRESIIVVGAQAVYLHVGDANLTVAPFTSDGDLVLDPASLAEIPPLEIALRNAGFLPKKEDSVGVWVTQRPSLEHDRTEEVCIDLLVPANVSPGKGRRAARLAGHDARAARKVVGLEGALVDVGPLEITSLEEHDRRRIEVNVAGPAALLVAKLIKISDRKGTDRQTDKDALDIVRILRGVDTNDLSKRMTSVLEDPRSAEVTNRALELLRTTFGRRGGVGIDMAIGAARGLVDAEELTASCTALASALLDALDI